MKIHIWGANGSIPTPTQSNDIFIRIFETLQLLRDSSHVDAKELFSSGAEILQFMDTLPDYITRTYQGNTSCVEIDVNDENNIFICDAGTGLKAFGDDVLTRKKKYNYHIFLSHPHWDHIQGFPFFVPAYIPNNIVKIYGVHENLKGIFELQQTSPNFPVPMSIMSKGIEFIQLKENEPIEIGDVKVNNIKLDHPGGSYSYRFEHKDSSLVYATDGEYKDLKKESLEKYINFYRGADVLIFDAQYTFFEACQKYDWGHSSVSIGIEMAAPAGVGKLLLFHHEPNYSDRKLHEILQLSKHYKNEYVKHHKLKKDFDILLAYDGLEFEI